MAKLLMLLMHVGELLCLVITFINPVLHRASFTLTSVFSSSYHINQVRYIISIIFRLPKKIAYHGRLIVNGCQYRPIIVGTLIIISLESSLRFSDLFPFSLSIIGQLILINEKWYFRKKEVLNTELHPYYVLHLNDLKFLFYLAFGSIRTAFLNFEPHTSNTTTWAPAGGASAPPWKIGKNFKQHIY
jgi:hypothetical protein